MTEKAKNKEALRLKVRHIFDLMRKLNMYCAYGSGEEERAKMQLVEIRNKIDEILNDENER